MLDIRNVEQYSFRFDEVRAVLSLHVSVRRWSFPAVIVELDLSDAACMNQGQNSSARTRALADLELLLRSEQWQKSRCLQQHRIVSVLELPPPSESEHCCSKGLLPRSLPIRFHARSRLAYSG